MGARLLHRLSPRAPALRGRVLESGRLERRAATVRQGLRALAAGAALLLAGCVPSLHPFYTSLDLAFDPRLLGTWSPRDEQKETWVFSAHQPDAYRLVHTDDKGRAGRFQVRLLRLEGKTFLDLYPEELPGEPNDYYKLHLLRAHTLLHLKSIEPKLVFTTMNPRWLDKHLEADSGAIAHERYAGGIVLTADTPALQAFMLKHLDTKDAFGKPAELERRGRG
jgi:hypothetical protein